MLATAKCLLIAAALCFLRQLGLTCLVCLLLQDRTRFPTAVWPNCVRWC